jgi:hypothetical protein
MRFTGQDWNLEILKRQDLFSSREMRLPRNETLSRADTTKPPRRAPQCAVSGWPGLRELTREFPAQFSHRHSLVGL